MKGCHDTDKLFKRHAYPIKDLWFLFIYETVTSSDIEKF